MSNNIPARIKAIRERIAAATPGEWMQECEHSLDNPIGEVTATTGETFKYVCRGTTVADAKLISFAPADLAFLTAALEVAMGALEKYAKCEHFDFCGLAENAPETELRDKESKLINACERKRRLEKSE